MPRQACQHHGNQRRAKQAVQQIVVVSLVVVEVFLPMNSLLREIDKNPRAIQVGKTERLLHSLNINQNASL